MRGGRRLAVCALAGALALTAAPRPGASHDAGPGRGVPPAPAPFTARPSLGVIRPALDFTLRDPSGAPVSLSDFRGRVVLVSFIYTACPAACPLVTQRMAVLQRRLRAARLFPARVGFLSVTVDPERDGADVLARYAKGFGADPAGWHFLRESRARLLPVLAGWDEWTTALPGGEIDHPARLYLIDPAGRIREIYSLSFFDERQAFLDVRALLREPAR